MTPMDFLKKFTEFLKELYKDERLSNTAGEKKPPSIYPQELPLVESTEESVPDEYPSPPYVMPKVMSWRGGFQGAVREITVRVIFCVFDTDKKNQGQLTVLHLEEMLYQALGKHPYIGNFAVSDDDFTAAITEEDNYPYYFGGIEFAVEGAAVIREDGLA